MNYKKILFIPLLISLSGCSQLMNKSAQVMNPGGEADYACTSNPGGGLKCKSVRDIYNITSRPGYSLEGYNNRQQQSRNQYAGDRRSGNSNRDSYEGRGSSAFGSLGGIPSGSRGNSIPRPARGPLPIRTPAKVMKIWIAPWNDKNGDLHVPAYVYTEIEGRKWQVGKNSNTTSSTRFYSVQSREQSKSSQTKKKKTNKRNPSPKKK